MGDNKQTFLYMHAGSGNHGCEAIVTSTLDMMNGDEKTVIVSNNAEEDRKYILGDYEKNEKCTLLEENHIDEHFLSHVLYYGYRKVSGDKESFLRYRFRTMLKEIKRAKSQHKNILAVSIGGDNYCYPDMVNDIILTDRVLHKKKLETVLLGCSIEPSSLKGDNAANLIADLNSHKKIIARESISYKALLAAGIKKEKLALCPDPAFTLETGDVTLPEGFEVGNTVGLNLSPMVLNLEKADGLLLKSYRELVKHIISATDMQIAFIPHVVWNSSDDRDPLNKLYNEFKKTGRVCIIEDNDCKKLKGYISKCSLFIGARTHATIAAYSSMVPTLVIGYSVKSKGIATDLFGTYDRFVLPVQELEDSSQLLERFEWLRVKSGDIREHLKLVIPEYIEQARKNVQYLK
ncbi:MAG: polysaccharide pyruvyl transferase family protein [Butyrivibrio sp.]|nr:polysaccharide pyruvyl transferase family protein [Butyrivibrio sp.]